MSPPCNTVACMAEARDTEFTSSFRATLTPDHSTLAARPYHAPHVSHTGACTGTIFHDILLWTAELIPPGRPHRPNPVTPGDRAAHSVSPVHTLRGHTGSVLRLRWACGLRLLLSAADDRTARAWRLPRDWWRRDKPPTAAAPHLQPTMTLWGHGARVWDAACIGQCAPAPPAAVSMHAMHAYTHVSPT